MSSTHSSNADGSGAFGTPGAPGWAERSRAASNPAISNQAIRDYAHDPHYFVRVAVAKNPAATDVLLSLLAADQSRLVRASVAFNPNVSLDLFAVLQRDSDFWVRQAARENFERVLTGSSAEGTEIAA
ncbi:MAG TPA: hypothetical protein VGG85_13965 [Terracidiphilus sp.]